MPTGQEYGEGLRTVSEWVDQIGAEVVDSDIEGETGKGEELSGYGCRMGQVEFLVLGSPSWEYFMGRYEFDLAVVWAGKSIAGEEEVEEGIELSEDEIATARESFDQQISEFDESKLKSMRMNLLHQLLDEEFTVHLNTTNPNRIHGFTLDTKMFLYEDSFTLSEFARGIQNLVNTGWEAREFLVANYGLSDAVEETGPESVSRESSGRSFM